MKVGGNIFAFLQIYNKLQENAIGEITPSWVNVAKIKGWLDFTGGGSKYTTYNAKIEEATHIFICDYTNLHKLHFLLDSNDENITDNGNIAIQTASGANGADAVNVNSENARMIIDGLKYDVLFVDDPMNLHKQLEIYLKFTGGDANG